MKLTHAKAAKPERSLSGTKKAAGDRKPAAFLFLARRLTGKK
jgi:hypothetical protein